MAEGLRYVANGGISLCVETRGYGPAHLLFVHGWISSRRIWWEVADRLDPARFTSHLLDLRGAGLSDRPAVGHDLEGYSSDVRAAIAGIGEPVILVGHSAGGKIAQHVACIGAPLLLRALVLVAPGSAATYVTNPRHKARAMQAYGSRRHIEIFQRASMRRDPGPAVTERLVEDALIAQREAWTGWYEHGRAVDFSAALGGIRVPCFILAGDRDGLATEKRVREEIAERIEGSQLVVLRDMGHNIPVEGPEFIAQAVERMMATRLTADG